MATQQDGEKTEQASSVPAVGLGEMIQDRYQKIREHAETYPYVWGSYIVVYGGLALWTAYRWRKLRKTEDRVRGLQERLRKLVDEETSANASKSVQNAQPPADKTPK